MDDAVNGIDIDTVDMGEIRGIIGNAAIAYTSHLRTSFLDAVQDSGAGAVLKSFDQSLRRQVGLLLRENADQIVAALRKDFDTALRVVKTAHKAGVGNATELTALLDSGSSEAIAAYRALPRP